MGQPGSHAPANLTLRWDCRRGVPLADGSVKYIRCEHFLEHLDIVDEVPRLLRSCHRVLKPGGILRIVVPDAGRYLRAYVSGNAEAWRALGWDLTNLPVGFHTGLDVINHVFRQGHEHLYAYDFQTLAERLHEAGFSQVREMSFGKSQDSNLEGDLENHRPYSLYVEAIN